jgi:hypothetical protein
MTDYTELNRLAEDVNQNFPNKEDLWSMVCTPSVALDLIADNEQLAAQLCECPSCGGQGEIYTGQNTWEGHFQPPEPIMEKCGECDGDGTIGDAEYLTSLITERDQLKTENEAWRLSIEAERRVHTATLQGLQAELDRLKGPVFTEELEALRKDAKRYRFLRNQHWPVAYLAVVVNPKVSVKLGHDCPSGERLDEQVDGALKRESSHD